MYIFLSKDLVRMDLIEQKNTLSDRQILFMRPILCI